MPSTARISTCVNCRQMKVKCNAKEVFPAPCSRCRKNSLNCFVDPSFQRIAKRKRAEELERELREMKKAAHVSPMSSEPDSLAGPATSSVSALSVPPLRPPPSILPYDCALIPNHVFKTQTIGEIELSPSTVAEILTCYFTSQHEEFPILPDFNTFIQSYDQCPFLFWVVVATAAKSFRQYTQLYAQLEPHIRLLSTSLHVAVNYPLETVQALLLLCWWPFPFGAKRTDPSWINAGMAAHLALQHGLHRPYHHSDFVYQAPLNQCGIQTYRKAWIGCFIVNQNLGSELGLPSTVAPDTTILTALDGHAPKLPKLLEQHLRIALHSYHICQTLGNSDSAPSGMHPVSFGVVKLLDRGFKDLNLKLGPNLSPCVRMTLFRAKLQLYSFVLTDHAVAELAEKHGKQSVDIRIVEYVSKAKQIAMQLIETASLRARSPPPPTMSSTLTSPSPWPSMARISVIYASQVLLKLLDYSEHPDREVIKNSIGQAWMLLNSRSELEHDTWARMSAIIAYLSRAGPADALADKPKPVSARMSANLVYDGVWWARGRFSEQLLRENPGDYTTAEAVNDIVELGFDLAACWETADEMVSGALQQPPPLDLVFGEHGT